MYMSGGSTVKLALAAAEEYIKRGAYLLPPAVLPPDMLRQRACYITIYENPGSHFRSGYGSPLPQYPNLAQEIIMNTIAAIERSATHAFRPVDLGYLTLTVGVVDALERISRPEHLNPTRYGLYLRSDRGKQAIILPNRAGIETPDDQIATAFRESGIDSRSEAVTMYRFPVTFYEG